MFNPLTGQLFLQIIHTSVWAGQKRLGQENVYRVTIHKVTIPYCLPVECNQLCIIDTLGPIIVSSL